MDNTVMNEIKDFAIQRLKQSYGFCGVADGDKMALINSTDENGVDIKISFKSLVDE